MSELERLMEEYERAVGDRFPLMMVRGMPDEEVAKVIRECVASGQQYAGRSGVVY